MADPVIPASPAPVAPSPAAVAPSPTPVAATPPSAPVETAQPASPPAPSTVEATPSSPDVKQTEPAKPAEAAKPAIPTAPASLISEAGKDKPAAEAPADPAQPPSEPAPSYQPFTLPEGVSLDEKELGQFHGVLGKHKLTQETGQELLDLHVNELNRFSERLTAHQHEVFNRTREGWRNEFIADRDIGQNRRETTLQTCGSMIERYGGDSKQVAELRSMLTFTGAGDHPALIRFINNMGRALSEPVPVAASKPPAQKQSKAQARYGNMQGS